MGSGWENEVKEILERAKVLEHQTKNRQRAAITLEERRRINPVIGLGNLILKRISTVGDMVVTGMVCVLAALLLSALPGGRLISPILAVGGGGLLMAAYVRRLLSRRSLSTTCGEAESSVPKDLPFGNPSGRS